MVTLFQMLYRSYFEIVRILLHHSAPGLRYKEDLAGTIPLFCGVEATNNNVCKELLAKEAEAQVFFLFNILCFKEQYKVGNKG